MAALRVQKTRWEVDGALMLEPLIYIFSTRFREESYYVDVVELFHKVTFQTEMGQLVDLITASEDHIDLGMFSFTKHVSFFFFLGAIGIG
jgi:farnesyl diphosphate synthase